MTQAYDVVVVGAGFSGLYMLHRLRAGRRAGARLRGRPRASAAPGSGTAIRARGSTSRARSTPTRSRPSSTPSGTGPSATPRSPSCSRYLNHVADRFDLRRDIQLETARHAQPSATRPRGAGPSTTDRGDAVTARHVRDGHRLPLDPQGGRRLRRARTLSRAELAHRPLARGRRRLHRQARRGDRHRLVGDPGRSRRSPRRRRTSPSSSARPTSASRPTTARSTSAVAD